jgi:predicted kinase
VTWIDATNLTPGERRPYIAIAKAYGCRAEAVFFDVSAAVCRERNEGRSRVVPGEAIENMARKLVPPSVEEGFDSVEVVKPSGF